MAVEVQLRAAAVAVEERGAPQDAEAEPLGAPPLAVEAADAPRLEAALEARGARLEAVEVKAPGALPRPEVGVEVRGARPMAALVVGPAAVSAGQSPARRLALAEAVARAVPAAVALVVLTTVPAAWQRLQHLASVAQMALSSAPVEAVFRAAGSVGQSPARRFALAAAVARAVPAAVALVVLTTVPAAWQRLQHLASVAQMALSSAPVEVVFRAAGSVLQSPARRLALAEAVARAVPAAVALVVLTTVPAAWQRLQHLASVAQMALSSAPDAAGWPGCCDDGVGGEPGAVVGD